MENERVIVQTLTFMDWPDGRTIHEHIPSHALDELPEDLPRFSTQITVPIGFGPHGAITAQGNAAIDGSTIEEAFKNYDECVQRAAREIAEAARAEASKKRIVLPGENPNPNGMKFPRQ